MNNYDSFDSTEMTSLLWSENEKTGQGISNATGTKETDTRSSRFTEPIKKKSNRFAVILLFY